MLGAIKRKVKFLLALPWLAGSRFQCVFCNGRFRRMLPCGVKSEVFEKYKVVGAGLRENAKCPWCGSSDRERLLYLFLKNKTDVFRGKMRLLNIAPEWRLEKLFRRCPQLEYITSDINGNVDVRADLQKLPFESGSFDAVICCHVLEHVADDKKAMKELLRVLKPGGWAVLQVPISFALDKTIEDKSVVSREGRLRVFGQEDHVRLYGKDYLLRLKKAGFAVEVIDIIKEMGLPDRYALAKDEKIFFCGKRQ